MDAKTLAHLFKSRSDFFLLCTYQSYTTAAAVLETLHNYCTKPEQKTGPTQSFNKYELPEFEGTDLFGKAGLNWIKEQLPKLDEDQFVIRSLIYEIRTHNLLCEETEKEIARHVEIAKEGYLLMTIIGSLLYSYVIPSRDR